LSDNGPAYIASDLAKYLAEQDMKHTRGSPYHPQTQGKIERWHCSLKNQILLENYYLPGELEARIERLVDYYNNDRSHESLNNLTPVSVYFARGEPTLARRQQIKLNTMAMRRKMHERNRVEPLTLMS